MLSTRRSAGLGAGPSAAPAAARALCPAHRVPAPAVWVSDSECKEIRLALAEADFELDFGSGGGFELNA
eukprot:10110987-Alexandrium_andersonii.AAC.1